MLPDSRIKPVKLVAASDIYTVLVIAVFFVCAASSVFVALKCYNQFGSLFSIQ